MIWCIGTRNHLDGNSIDSGHFSGHCWGHFWAILASNLNLLLVSRFHHSCVCFNIKVRNTEEDVCCSNCTLATWEAESECSASQTFYVEIWNLGLFDEVRAKFWVEGKTDYSLLKYTNMYVQALTPQSPCNTDGPPAAEKHTLITVVLWTSPEV